MKNIFLIFGYGVSDDITKDERYVVYLTSALNKIYEISSNDKVAPIIICSGGVTDMTPPYKRNEANGMIDFFTWLIKERQYLKPILKKWIFIPEKKSLSTLENIIFCKNIIEERKIDNGNVYVFCEYTRRKRVQILTKKVFPKNYAVRVIPVDFDLSPRRYLDPGFLEEKENTEIDHSLWALKSMGNFKKHHEAFEEKMKILREHKGEQQMDVLKKYWSEKLKSYST